MVKKIANSKMKVPAIITSHKRRVVKKVHKPMPKVQFGHFNENHADRGVLMGQYTNRYCYLMEKKPLPTDVMVEANERLEKAIRAHDYALMMAQRILQEVVREMGKTLTAEGIKFDL